MAKQTWHPILQAREYQPGRWVMEDALGRPFALIDILRIKGEVGYKVTAWKEAGGPVLGYFTNLAAAAKHAHMRWVGRSTPAGERTLGYLDRDDPWADPPVENERGPARSRR